MSKEMNDFETKDIPRSMSGTSSMVGVPVRAEQLSGNLGAKLCIAREYHTKIQAFVGSSYKRETKDEK
jgi:hypothetical protein